jgi:hypothetical protein
MEAAGDSTIASNETDDFKYNYSESSNEDLNGEASKSSRNDDDNSSSSSESESDENNPTEEKETKADEGASSTGAGGGLGALLDLGTAKGPGAPRPSIAALEPSFLKRRVVLAVYIGLTFLVATLTSLKFFRSVGIIPTLPEFTPVVDSTAEFYTVVNGTSVNVADEIDRVYFDSLAIQDAQCLNSLDRAREEQSRIRNESRDFAEFYCQDLSNRTFTALEERGLLAGVTARCLISSNGIDEQFNWAYEDSLGLVSYYGAIEMLNPFLEGCFEPAERGPNYEFDNIFVIPSVTQLPSTERCLAQRIRMRNEYETNTENQAAGFAESLSQRLEYDRNYFLGSQAGFFDINADARAIEIGPFPNIRTTLEDFQLRIQADVNYISIAFDAWQTLYATVPIGPNIPSPDLSVPDLPEADFDMFTNLLQNIRFTTNYFEDYNPPQLAAADVSLQFEAPSFEFSTPETSLNLQSSTILMNMQETFQNLATFITAFENFDLFIRICFWLQEVAVVFKVKRRDFSSFTSKAKKTVNLLFKNSNLLLFLGLLIWGIAFVAQFRFSFDFVEEELFVVCNNNIVGSNLETLADYTSELAEKRASCDASIRLENNRSVSDYAEIYGPMEELATDYEIRYQAIDVGPTFTLPPEFGSVVLPLQQDFAIDSFYGVDPLEIIPPLPLTPIETFEVSAMGQCSNGTEAQEVRSQTEDYTSELIRYVTGFMLVTLVLNASAKGMMWSFRQVWWLDLTEGYTSDVLLTSGVVKAKVKSKRIQAGIVFTIALAASVTVIVLGANRVFG